MSKLEFAAGEIYVEATVGSAESEAGQVVAYVFRPGEHDEIVTSMGSGEPAVLGAREYDLRVVWSVDSEEKDVRWLPSPRVSTTFAPRIPGARRRHGG